MKTGIYKPEGALFGSPDNDAYFSISGLEKALVTGKILEGRTEKCDSCCNLTMAMGDIRGIIPACDVAMTAKCDRTRNISAITRVGKPSAFKVTGFDTRPSGKLIPILSRAAAQEEFFDNVVRTLIPGDILPARITHLEPFGAFCDIGCGFVSLIPIDCISVSRISHANERFRVGQWIYAVVKSVDIPNCRITLSHKELLGTWEENAALFEAGQTVLGIVRSVESYGVFIELTPNLAGLAEVRPGVCPGDGASVYIKSIIPEKMKVKLSIVDTFPLGPIHGEIKYFGASERMDRFRYSPEGAPKLVETVFI